MVNVMYFAHLFRWFSVRASLRTLPQSRQLLALHYCNLPSLQTTVCVWEWHDPPPLGSNLGLAAALTTKEGASYH